MSGWATRASFELPPRASATTSGSAYGTATSRCFGATWRSRPSQPAAACAPRPGTDLAAEAPTR